MPVAKTKLPSHVLAILPRTVAAAAAAEEILQQIEEAATPMPLQYAFI